MIDFPKIKKRISAFLSNEDAKISKESLLKTGLLVSATALASMQVSADCPPGAISHDEHCNAPGFSQEGEGVMADHNQGHGNHTSY